MKTGSYFVTGTDTNIGKTVVSSILCAGLRAAYWKPVQTGAKESRDSDFLARWSELVFPEVHCLEEPLSPHAAARVDGIEISLERILSKVPETSRPLIVEGAGGVLVPLNDRHFMIDIARSLGIPAIVVSRSSLGTINHTLLTLEALRRRNIAVAGVVMVGPLDSGNRAAIENHGKTPIIGEVSFTKSFTKSWMLKEFHKIALPTPPARRVRHALA